MKRIVNCGLGILLMVGLTGCIDLGGPKCDDCPDDARWQYACLGWIAPVCDTYCLSSTEDGGVRLLDECCCGKKDMSKASVENISWRPLKAYEVFRQSADR